MLLRMRHAIVDMRAQDVQMQGSILELRLYKAHDGIVITVKAVAIDEAMEALDDSLQYRRPPREVERYCEPRWLPSRRNFTLAFFRRKEVRRD